MSEGQVVNNTNAIQRSPETVNGDWPLKNI